MESRLDTGVEHYGVRLNSSGGIFDTGVEHYTDTAESTGLFPLFPVERLKDFFQLAVGDVGVDLGGGDGGVAE